MTAAAIQRLSLSNFRSYHAASIDVSARLVVLTGPNGAGKTNLIEAISFLVPGRGLRRALRERRPDEVVLRVVLVVEALVEHGGLRGEIGRAHV